MSIDDLILHHLIVGGEANHAPLPVQLARAGVRQTFTIHLYAARQHKDGPLGGLLPGLSRKGSRRGQIWSGFFGVELMIERCLQRFPLRFFTLIDRDVPFILPILQK
jgi:hypothetical protein